MLYGADLAKYFTSRIILVNALSLPLGGYDSMAPLNVIGDMQTAAQEVLRENKKTIIDRLGYDPGIELVTEIGSVHAVINDAMNKYGC